MPRPRDKLFHFDGLADFLHFLDWACGLANTHERLARMAYDFCQRLQSDGTGYADVIVNPTHWTAWRGRTNAMIEARSPIAPWRSLTLRQVKEIPMVPTLLVMLTLAALCWFPIHGG